MRSRTLVRLALCGALLSTIGCGPKTDGPVRPRRETPARARAETPTPKERLGKRLFFDKRLSRPPGQACADCHGPSVGFTGPDESVNRAGGVYAGAVSTRFGNRKPPASAYCGDSPELHWDAKENSWVGGMFWDGRATGAKLKDPLAEQAQGPFLNPLEHNLPDAKAVCELVSKAPYAPLFRTVWGPGSLDCARDATRAFERIARAIAAYERSREVNPFSSKFDLFLAGKVKLSPLERQGLTLFRGKAKCENCHPSKPRPGGKPPLFTDFTYDNLGIPANPKNPFYRMGKPHNPAGRGWVDLGLGGYLKSVGKPKAVYEPQLGKMKVPTLRNVALTPKPGALKVFGHNGYFRSLTEIVRFYNDRDVLPSCAKRPKLKPRVQCWPPAEVLQNINRAEMGNLGLTQAEVRAVVAFLGTLSDGYRP